MNRKILFLIGVSFVISLPGFSSPPKELETTYAEAVTLYHQEQYDKALTLLKQATKDQKPPRKVLELEALCLRLTNRLDEAASIYESILRDIKDAEKESVQPVYFELGVISFHQKRLNKAREHFSKNIGARFNQEAVFLYMGMMDFQEKRWLSAKKWFEKAADNDNAPKDNANAPLKTLALLYLGQVFSELRAAQSALKSFVASREIAEVRLQGSESTVEKEMAKKSVTIAGSALSPLTRGFMVANAGITMGYDSNVFTLPVTSALASSSASNLGSMVALATADLGYSSSRAKFWHFSTSYRIAANFNSNSQAHDGQFLANEIEFKNEWSPLKKWSYGIDMLAKGIFRYGDNGSGSNHYYFYLLSGELGPTVKHQLSLTTNIGAKLLFSTQKSYLDSQLESQYQRTGGGGKLRIYLQHEPGSQYFNPTVALNTEVQGPQGREFRSKGFYFEWVNAMPITKKLKLSPSITLGWNSYSDRTDGERKDILAGAAVHTAYALSEISRLFSSVQYTYNHSTVTNEYTYQRFQVNTGINFSL